MRDNDLPFNHRESRDTALMAVVNRGFRLFSQCCTNLAMVKKFPRYPRSAACCRRYRLAIVS